MRGEEKGREKLEAGKERARREQQNLDRGGIKGGNKREREIVHGGRRERRRVEEEGRKN